MINSSPGVKMGDKSEILHDGWNPQETFSKIPTLIPGNWIKWIMLSGRIESGIILGVNQIPPPRNVTELHILTPTGEVKIISNLIFRLKVIA